MEDRGLKLDRVLCDPDAALEFDRIVISLVHKSVAESLTPLKMRWTALDFRKKMRGSFVNYALKLRNAIGLDCFGVRVPFCEQPSIPSSAGLYLLETESRVLYIGETSDLNRRLFQQTSSDRFNFWNHPKYPV